MGIKKRTKDAGLQHVIKLGFRYYRKAESVYSDIFKQYDPDTADKICRKFFSADAEIYDKDHKLIYDKKNEDFDMAMLFTSAFDADTIRNIVNWIDAHKEYFGDTILEVGCDCGFITTFLGTIFPEKKIISIDRCKNGLEITRKNLEKFGITNVELIHSSLEELEDRKFDTVLSVRTAQENILKSPADEWRRDYLELAQEYYDNLKDYATALKQHMQTGGNVISIERSERSPLSLGWLMAMGNADLYADTASSTELICKEFDEKYALQANVFTQNNSGDILQNYYAYCNKYGDLTAPHLEGWDAQFRFVVNTEDLIDGFALTGKNEWDYAEFALAIDKSDPSSLFIFRLTCAGMELFVFDISELEGYKKDLHENVQRYEKEGYTVTPLKNSGITNLSSS